MTTALRTIPCLTLDRRYQSLVEYGGSVTELPPPWCLFVVKECHCIFELGLDKSVFYPVCGINVLGGCKRPGHATGGEKAAVGYYEPVNHLKGKLRGGGGSLLRDVTTQ
jgi:hypothetical protein